VRPAGLARQRRPDFDELQRGSERDYHTLTGASQRRGLAFGAGILDDLDAVEPDAMTQPFTQIDAFTAEPFTGNPAAVCVLPAPRDADWMQAVAREMNLSETAFLVRRPDEAFDLRWFTPGVEVDLCGHATLASAHALWEDGHLRPGVAARFHTRSGLLTAERRGDWIELDLPATPDEPSEAPPGLTRALGVDPVYVGRSRFDVLVEARDEHAVRRMTPDFAALRALPVRGVIVTSRASTPGLDFVSRFFAPAAGIDEDPVTGSAHCCLAPYWHRKLGRSSFVARQVSSRGGVLRVELDGDRVRLQGQAVTVMKGHLCV
jgi:PhzF family phenazine biosynthesis protein